MEILSNLFNLFTVKNAYAASSGQSSFQGTLISFAPLIAIVVIFYLLVIVPQQKRTKKHKQMMESLRTGDEVLTNGGIYGVISGVAENVFTLEIAKDIRIKIAKNAVATKTSKS